ncbi:MAG TPA: caspase family protein [Smithella sp.]|nr:caspase family protein [Smithella sp.]
MRSLFKMIRFKAIMISLVFAIFFLIPCSAFAYRGMEIESRDDLSHKSGKLGEYKALIIGINNYQDSKIPALKTAVNDATELASVLKTMYGFEVTLLLDRQATRQAVWMMTVSSL